MRQSKTDNKQSWQICLKYSIPIPGCLAITAENTKVLCYAMGRIQERFENVEFNGKNFDYWEMNNWYKERFGFNYHDMWNGFGIPVREAMTPFLTGELKEGYAHEKRLVELVKANQPKYIFGYGQDDFKVYKHELRHAMWYLSPTYRGSCMRILKKYQLKHPDNYAQMEEFLRSMKYPEERWWDEMQAHIQEQPWSTQFKLGNLEMHKYRKAFLRGIDQLNATQTEEMLDVTGTIRLKRKIEKVTVEGLRNKFQKGKAGAKPTTTQEDSYE